MRRVFEIEQVDELMTVRAQLERAYLHTPFDVFARVLLASHEEVLALHPDRAPPARAASGSYDVGSTNAGTCEAARTACASP